MGADFVNGFTSLQTNKDGALEQKTNVVEPPQKLDTDSEEDDGQEILLESVGPTSYKGMQSRAAGFDMGLFGIEEIKEFQQQVRQQ